MLKATNLHLWRGERHVLRGVNFTLEPGELLHVSGPNGTGKTTLLRAIAGLAHPEEGSVTWRGASTSGFDSRFCEELGYVAHDAGLKGDLTARENLAFMVRLRRSVADAELDDCVERLGLAACKNISARALSAGQRRRVALARLLLCAVPLWLLDEPLTNLDAAGTALVLELLGAHLSAGGLALVATHGELPVKGGHVRPLVLS